jgi:acyl carrier protein
VFLPSWRRIGPADPVDSAPADPVTADPAQANLTTWRVLGDHDLARDVAAGLAAAGHRVIGGAAAEGDAGTVVDLTAVGAAPSFDDVRQRLRGRYWLVADGLYRVESTDRVEPAKSPLLGLLAVAQQEDPRLRCHVVEITAGVDVDAVIAELVAPAPPPVVALRGAIRSVPDFAPLEETRRATAGGATDSTVGPAAGPRGRAIGLRRGGVYLVTGGTGRIGGLLARHLRREWDATVVATGRGDQSSVDGAVVVRADVAIEDDLRAAVEYCEREFGALHGIFHAAGLAGARAVRLLSQTDSTFVAEQFRAKVTGSTVLRRVLAGRPLDFCLLMSSTAAVFGGPGLAAYAAANNHLDAIADQAMGESGTRWLSVNWDRWGYPGGSDGEFTVPPEEALSALEQILGSGLRGRVLVCAGSPAARWEKWRMDGTTSASSRESRETRETGESHRMRDPHEIRDNRDDRETRPAPARGSLEEVVTQVWQRVLGVERVGLDDNFFDLGGDSLIGLRLVGDLERRLGTPIPVLRLFEGPTVRALCRLLRDQGDDETAELRAVAERGRRRVRLLSRGSAQVNHDG